MKEFTRQNLSNVRKVIDKALTEAGKELDITLKIGNISFDSNSFRTKIEGLTGTNSNDHAKAEWDKYCTSFGFNKEHFGVTHGKYTIVGISPRSRKYPILATIAGRNGTFKLDCYSFTTLEGVKKDFF